ncbi:MAG: hypothetical protein WCG01_02020 [bacterium]
MKIVLNNKAEKSYRLVCCYKHNGVEFYGPWNESLQTLQSCARSMNEKHHDMNHWIEDEIGNKFFATPPNRPLMSEPFRCPKFVFSSFKLIL